mmetsp:Transcript_15442/g.47783  ORF Transcript_15442/g.47783 Transcript_15442/m.47783 type:complete len:358 (-) Transcript_15442:84-1157(-)
MDRLRRARFVTGDGELDEACRISRIGRGQAFRSRGGRVGVTLGRQRGGGDSLVDERERRLLHARHRGRVVQLRHGHLLPVLANVPRPALERRAQQPLPDQLRAVHRVAPAHRLQAPDRPPHRERHVRPPVRRHEPRRRVHERDRRPAARLGVGRRPVDPQIVVEPRRVRRRLLPVVPLEVRVLGVGRVRRVHTRAQHRHDARVFAWALREQRGELPREEHARVEIERELLIDPFDRRRRAALQRRLRLAEDHVVEVGFRLSDARGERPRVAHQRHVAAQEGVLRRGGRVGGVGRCGRVQLFHHLGARVGVAPDDNDARAAARQPDREGAPDARRRPDDERLAPRQRRRVRLARRLQL